MTPTPVTSQTAVTPQGHQHPRLCDDATTPTRASFNTTMASQKPLPSSPFPQAVQIPDSTPKSKVPRRGNSQHSTKSVDSADVDMDDSDGETGTIDDGQASDDESVNADGSRSNKKKKSQRFYCTDYPPCNLSFTRSEHLARHIRYAAVLSWHIVVNLLTCAIKETHRRASIPVPLFPTILQARQPETARSDRSC